MKQAKKHQIGEILDDITSLDGEMYIYGHIDKLEQILVDHRNNIFPDSPELPQGDEPFKLDHILMRCVPCGVNPDNFTYHLEETQQKGYGVMPITILIRLDSI